MVAPKVVSATASSALEMDVLFDQAMNAGDAGDIANYNIPGRTITGVSFAVATATLTVWPKWKSGDPYVVEVGPSVRNALAEYMDPAFKSAPFTGFNSAPTLNAPACVATSSRRVRVAFDGSMSKDIDLADPGNYVLAPFSPGAALVDVINVVVPHGANPDYVDLDTTEMTDGATYTLIVVGVRDIAGNPLAGPAMTSVTGIGVRPTITSVAAISANRVDVKFSEAMQDNADIRDPTKYVFDNGLVTLQVLAVDGDTVRLATTDQDSETVYQLTVFP